MLGCSWSARSTGRLFMRAWAGTTATPPSCCTSNRRSHTQSNTRRLNPEPSLLKQGGGPGKHQQQLPSQGGHLQHTVAAARHDDTCQKHPYHPSIAVGSQALHITAFRHDCNMCISVSCVFFATATVRAASVTRGVASTTSTPKDVPQRNWR